MKDASWPWYLAWMCGGTWSSAFMVMMIPKNMLMTGMSASLFSLSSILGYFSFDRMVKRKR